MKKQKVDTKLGVAIIVVFAITVGALMWIYENSKSTTTQQNQITNNVQQKNQTQEQETTIPPVEVGLQNQNIPIDTWKTYTNKKEGYSIKYPSAWLSSFVDESSFFVKELRKNGKDYPSFGNVLSDNLENLKNVNGDYFINISVNPGIGNHADLKEWRKYNGANYQEVTIRGYPALRFDEKPHKSYDDSNKDIAGTLSYYFIDNKNNGYEITIWYKNDSDGLGDKIISTLNITN